MTTTTPAPWWATFPFAQLILVLALLAAIGVLGARGTFTPTEVMTSVVTILGAAGISAGVQIGNPATSNTAVIPHLIVLLAALGVVTAMAELGKITDAQVYTILGLATGSGLLAIGASGTAPTPAPATTVVTSGLNTNTGTVVPPFATTPPPPPAGPSSSELMAQAAQASSQAQQLIDAATAAKAAETAAGT